MLSKLLVAFSLMALCVAIHAAGLVAILEWIRHRANRVAGRFWPTAWMLVRIAGWTVLLHLIQIACWSFYYSSSNALPDLASAFYFSAVTYTTTGYGDLVLPKEWRLVGGVEALTGILMCGLSAGLFFAVFTKAFGLNRENAPPP